MNSTTDILVASPDAFDAILADTQNAMELDATRDGNVTIDDVVSIIAIVRNVIDDRSAWWKVRREVYARYASHSTISSRTLAALPDVVRDELASLDTKQIETIASRWIEDDESTPSDLSAALTALRQLVDTSSRAKETTSGLLLRTNQPSNDFEVAFRKLDAKRVRTFQKAFDSWDASKRYEAHQRYNYYLKEGMKDCADLVLRDFTRPKTSRSPAVTSC